MTPITRTLSLLSLSVSSVFATDYYLDASRGDDSAAGKTLATAWRTIERINTAELEPGDRVLLKSGEVFTGFFHAQQSGSKDDPITLTAYGDGPKPIIAAEGNTEMALHLDNVSHWTVEGVEFTNLGRERAPGRRGILITADKGGVFENITIRANTIRDVNGVFSKDDGGGAGIFWNISNQGSKSRLDGLLIEDNHLYRCDRDGIRGWMHPWHDLSNLSTNTIIRRNLLEDIGGDGIVPLGMEGALVEYNRIYGLRKRIENINTDSKVSMNAGPSIGIWPWSSKNTHIRFNEVWGYEGTFDGQGFDSDFNSDNTLFEFNWSADNKGGFFLICSWSQLEDTGQSIGNTNTIIRHNISFNDHTRSFVLNGPIRNVSIYENIVYNTIEEELQLVIDTPWDPGTFSHSVSFRDNLFYTTGLATISQGTWHPSSLGTWQPQKPINRKTVTFEGNAYLNVEGFNGQKHEEPEMRTLNRKETLGSLVDRLEGDPKVREGFIELNKFLMGSRYWDKVKAAL